MQSSIVRFWMGEWWKALKCWIWKRARGIFNRTMTQNTLLDGPQLGSLTMISLLFTGLLNSHTSIPLNTSGIMSTANFKNIKYRLKECMNCGIEWQRSGMRYHQRYAKG